MNRGKDGGHDSEEMTITPVCDERRKILHFVSIKQDVTARKSDEETLREVHEALELQYRQADRARSETRSILDATSEAIALVSSGDRFLTVNRRQGVS